MNDSNICLGGVALGKIRHLIADLYFCNTSCLADQKFLGDLICKVLQWWSMANSEIYWVMDQNDGLSGLCLLPNTRLTFQTFPRLEFMTMEIITVGRIIDPRALGEQLVEALEPSLVSFELVVRGEHLKMDDRHL
jgi:S-adenosylmethionine decarboxylase